MADRKRTEQANRPAPVAAVEPQSNPSAIKQDETGPPAIDVMGQLVEAQEPVQPAQPQSPEDQVAQEPVALDTVDAGGRYEVDGTLVDANGQPVKGTRS